MLGTEGVYCVCLALLGKQWQIASAGTQDATPHIGGRAGVGARGRGVIVGTVGVEVVLVAMGLEEGKGECEDIISASDVERR